VERARLDKIKDVKRRLEEAKHLAQRQGQFELASRLRFSAIPELQRQPPAEGDQANRDEESPLVMLHDRVTSNDISRVVAKATGILVQNSLKGGRDKLVHVRCFLVPLIDPGLTLDSVQMEESLAARVVGKDHAVSAISDAVRVCKHPIDPWHRSCFWGPAGVGKVCPLLRSSPSTCTMLM